MKRFVLVVVAAIAAAIFLYDATHEAAPKSVPEPSIYRDDFHAFTSHEPPTREVDSEGYEIIDHGAGL